MFIFTSFNLSISGNGWCRQASDARYTGGDQDYNPSHSFKAKKNMFILIRMLCEDTDTPVYITVMCILTASIRWDKEIKTYNNRD